MSKATITFEDNGETMSMSIDFDGEVPDQQSSAHLAAAALYVEATKKLGEVDNESAE